MKLFNLPLMTNPLVASARVLGQPLEACGSQQMCLVGHEIVIDKRFDYPTTCSFVHGDPSTFLEASNA